MWTTWQDFLGKVGTAIDKIKEDRKQNNDDSSEDSHTASEEDDNVQGTFSEKYA